MRFRICNALLVAAASLSVMGTGTGLGATELAEVRPEPVPLEITGKDGAPMVFVPAGEFTMGSEGWDADEKPVHRVSLDAYYMDKFEVTTARYGRFMQETGREPPSKWKDVNHVTDGSRPVVGVAWHDADAYCRHYGKRLPTEAEWEKAARGTDGRRFPWGNEEPTRVQANFGATWIGYETLMPVGSLEAGKSPYGIYDLAGNAWEWVADWYDVNYYKSSPDRNPTGPVRGGSKVARGGSWYNMLYDLRSTNRNYFGPASTFFDLGFRCAQGYFKAGSR
jgi:formylglycine-generating enzyme required for sulfatase activity